MTRRPALPLSFSQQGHVSPMGSVSRRAFRLALGATLLASLLAAPLARAEDEPEGVAAALSTMAATEGAFVHVEYMLRYDEGQPPSTIGNGSHLGGLILQERPLDLAGIVVGPDRVLVSDPMIDPRFVESITVVAGTQRAKAQPFAWLATQDGLLLKTSCPLQGKQAPAFDAKAAPPYRSVFCGLDEGLWSTTVGPTLRQVTRDERGRVTARTWSPSLIVDGKDRAVGVALRDDLGLASGWQGNPLTWPLVSAEEHARLVARTTQQADASLRRVHLRLRSPKNDAGSDGFRFRDDDGDGDGKTERDAVGVLMDARRLIVLQALDAKTTSRLDSIEVFGPDGSFVPAKFVCSYRHFGAFLVQVDADLPGAATLRTTPVRALRDQLLVDAVLEIQGERRVLHVADARFSDFSEGRRRQILPELRGSASDHFLFDREGALVAIPVAPRSAEKENRWDRDTPILLPGAYVAPLLAEPMAHADPANVPVVAEREGRLAWLGVEVQDLDQDLARANGVNHLTSDGQSGVLVSYVYPGSPAQTAGLEPGHILLRIVSPDRPKPIDVRSSSESGMRSWFFDGGGEMGDEMAERMPGFLPWPTAESTINRLLTNLGIGKPFTLEYAVNGAVKKAELKVAEGPPHYEAAPLYKSEDLGLTVRDLTYEVRRHYQLEAATPGVIVSKTERGGRAAVAGLRRLNVVLRVGDQPVADVAAFQKAVEAAGTGEINLTVKEKLKERVVKIAAASASPHEASAPR